MVSPTQSFKFEQDLTLSCEQQSMYGHSALPAGLKRREKTVDLVCTVRICMCNGSRQQMHGQRVTRSGHGFEEIACRRRKLYSRCANSKVRKAKKKLQKNRFWMSKTLKLSENDVWMRKGEASKILKEISETVVGERDDSNTERVDVGAKLPRSKRL
jgi:hypothetical protein